MKARGRTAGIVALAALAIAGCGGARQDAHEPSANFTVSVVRASFPTHQSIAEHSQMVIAVRNTGAQTVPNVAVTVDGFAHRDSQPGLAAATRPTWIIDAEPVGGITATTDTWALGSLAPGAQATFTWHVTAVQAGSHVVTYTVAAGLNGKARAVDASGQAVTGSFPVDVSLVPAQEHVNPVTGAVESGPAPLGG